MFGELISIWIANEWMKLNKPKPLFLIELGPGRGTMMSDILRVFKKLNLLENVSCHLIEASPKMTRLQAESLHIDLESLNDEPNDSQCFCSGTTVEGVRVHWYNHLKSVPPAFSVVVAHEFFDALPVHKFRKTEKGWREVLIDSSDPTDLEAKKFRYVLSPNPTIATKLFVKESDTRCEIEVSPDSRIIMNELANRLEQFGGMALIADYGHDGSQPNMDTFRAYKGHKQIDPLHDPGSADLTVDVDFNFLKNNTLDKLISFGPITQMEFLSRMQIDVRMKALLEKSNDEDAKKSIISGYNMMMDPKQMGERFKFMCFFPAVLKDYLERVPVAGFSS
ncbi:protein arginine methyltransferase NDUFAF7, mitochondrial isoform X2 [Nilaparvata lugens]|nr:protein arginine methyltransferase NDUFAF7, mitochondrial isoform X2 [Nilaparvata lugens]